MLTRADLKPGSVVRLASGSIKLVVEAINTRGGLSDIHLIGWGDRVGVVRLVAKPECLCWPRPAEDRDAGSSPAAEATQAQPNGTGDQPAQG